jgi:hypothetical protein
MTAGALGIGAGAFRIRDLTRPLSHLNGLGNAGRSDLDHCLRRRRRRLDSRISHGIPEGREGCHHRRHRHGRPSGQCRLDRRARSLGIVTSCRRRVGARMPSIAAAICSCPATALAKCSFNQPVVASARSLRARSASARWWAADIRSNDRHSECFPTPWWGRFTASDAAYPQPAALAHRRAPGTRPQPSRPWSRRTTAP